MTSGSEQTGRVTTSNASGEAIVRADAGDYLLRVSPPTGYDSYDDISVSGLSSDVVIPVVLASIALPDPAGIGLCAVVCDAYLNGEPIEGAKFTARLFSANQAVDSAVLSTSITEATSDSEGRAVLHLVQKSQFDTGDARYVIESFHGSNKFMSVAVEIPDADSVVLASLL